MDIEHFGTSNSSNEDQENNRIFDEGRVRMEIKRVESLKPKKKEYQKIVLEGLSSEIINYLSNNTKSNYKAKLDSKSTDKNSVKTNIVTIYKKVSGILNRDKKICEIVGYQTFRDFDGESPPYDDVHVKSKTFEQKTLSEETLENILKDVKYDKILLKAENGYYHEQANSMVGYKFC